MFVAPFTFQPPAAGALAAPVLSNRFAWLKTDGNVWGGSGIGVATQAYTSSAGNVLYLGCARSTAATTRGMGEDWAGDAMTELATAKQDLANNLRVEAGLKAGGTIGAGTVSVQHDPVTADHRFRHLLAWLYDLDQVRGGVGGAAANVIAVVQGFVEVSLPVSQPGSLLVAAGWNQEENARPFTWSLGWTKLDEQAIGTGDQPCGSIASKISTAAGAETVRMTGNGITSGQWEIVALEFLRG